MSLQRVEIITEGAVLLFSTNILRFKLLDLKSQNNLMYPLCDRNFPVECPNQSHPKNGKIQTYFFFHFTSTHFLQKQLISLHSFFYYFLLPIPSLICYMKDHPWNFGPQVSRAWMWWVWTLHWKVSVTQKVQ